VIALLPAVQRRQIEALLGYNPSSAGGLMSPDFIQLGEADTVARAIEQVRRSDLAPGTLSTVYLRDAEGRLSGSVPVVTLLRGAAESVLHEIAEHEPESVGTDADLPEVARTMTDYNLVMLAVVDEDERMVGAITVDDVLEQTLPAGWRRRFGVVSD
jgi:Mg/Co/Ni transporter MgtE